MSDTCAVSVDTIYKLRLGSLDIDNSEIRVSFMRLVVVRVELQH